MRASRRTALAGLLVVLAAPGGVFAVAQDAPATQQAPLQPPSPAAPDGSTRVRLTAGPDVEVPGVIRFQGGIMSAAAIIRQDEDTVSLRVEGREVTVLRPKRRAVGVINDADAASLQLTSEAGRSVTVPRRAIERYEVSKGRISRLRNALIGFLVGTVAGCLITIATSDGCTEEPGALAPACVIPYDVAAPVVGAGLGAGIGAGIGALMPRPTRWTTLPLDQLPN